MFEQGMPPRNPPMPPQPIPMGQQMTNPMPMPAPGPQMANPPPAPVPPQTVHDVKISRVKKYGCVRIENVPPEEFGVTKRQRSVMLRDCDYCFHETITTESALIAEGFDKKQVEELPTYPGDSNTESLSRDTVDESMVDGDTINKANRPIRRTEHYINIDYEGDGKARQYRVTTGGEPGVILKHKGKSAIVPDMVRFAAMTPYIMTHRFFGRSAADLVMDIQRIKTALTRGLLNNVYFANNQRVIVNEESATKDTLDDILSNRVGGIIRGKNGAAQGGIAPMPNQEIGSFAFPMIQYMDSTREWRTGVTKQGQGLDPNALQNIGERAVLDAQSSARAKTKLIARIFAETGVKDMCWLVHATARQNATKSDTMKLRGEWVDVDPREFKQRDDLTVNVGLGNGSKEQEMSVVERILVIQGEAIKTPKMKLAKPENVYATLKRYGRLAGLKTIEPYFTDPSKTPDPPHEPSPDEKKLQADVQGKQMQLQFDQAKAKQDGQLQQAKAAQDAQLQREQMQLDHQLKTDQMMQELQLKREQLMAELQLKRELGIMSIASRPAAPNGGGTSSVHVGGEPG